MLNLPELVECCYTKIIYGRPQEFLRGGGDLRTVNILNPNKLMSGFFNCGSRLLAIWKQVQLSWKFFLTIQKTGLENQIGVLFIIWLI
jgi:hypothetical protein